MKEYIVKDYTNSKDLYLDRMKKKEVKFQDWMSKRKFSLTLDNQSLVHFLKISSYKELIACDKSKLNKQDTIAVLDAIKYCES